MPAPHCPVLLLLPWTVYPFSMSVICSLFLVTKYLQEVEDFELRLQLATDVEVFDVRIEVVFEVISPVRPT